MGKVALPPGHATSKPVGPFSRVHPGASRLGWILGCEVRSRSIWPSSMIMNLRAAPALEKVHRHADSRAGPLLMKELEPKGFAKIDDHVAPGIMTDREYPGDLEIADLENGFRIAGPMVQAEATDQLLDQQHVGRELVVPALLIRNDICAYSEGPLPQPP